MKLNNPHEVHLTSSKTLRSAGLFLASNLLILAFGFGRVASAAPSRSAASDWELAANVVQVLFSAASVLAITGHLLDGDVARMSTPLLKKVVVVSIVLAWFVFAVHLVYGIERVVDAPSGHTTTGEIFGLLGFIANCATSFGAAALFGLMVVHNEEGKGETTHTARWLGGRKVYYVFLYALFAVAAIGASAATALINGGELGNVLAPSGDTSAFNSSAINATDGDGDDGFAPAPEGEVPGPAGRLLQGEPEAEAEGVPEAEGAGEPEGAAEPEGAGFASSGPGYFGAFAVVVPGLHVALGVVMLAMAVVHLSVTVPTARYLAAASLTWLFQISVVALASPGLVGAAFAGSVAGMLTIPLAVMPVYLTVAAHEARKQQRIREYERQALPTKPASTSSAVSQV